jgi:chromosome segregation ATPase
VGSGEIFISRFPLKIRAATGRSQTEKEKQMATIASLAIKVMADIGDLKNKMMDATSATAKIREVADSANSQAMKTAKGIASMTPSVQGFQKACGQFSELKDLAKIMRDVTGNSEEFSGVLRQAQSAMGELAAKTVKAKIEAAVFNVLAAASLAPAAMFWKIVSAAQQARNKIAELRGETVPLSDGLQSISDVWERFSLAMMGGNGFIRKCHKKNGKSFEQYRRQNYFH